MYGGLDWINNTGNGKGGNDTTVEKIKTSEDSCKTRTHSKCSVQTDDCESVQRDRQVGQRLSPSKRKETPWNDPTGTESAESQLENKRRNKESKILY